MQSYFFSYPSENSAARGRAVVRVLLYNIANHDALFEIASTDMALTETLQGMTRPFYKSIAA